MAWVNGEEVALEAPPVLRGGRTLVPIRFIAESLGAEVEWDAARRAVVITAGSLPGTPPESLPPASSEQPADPDALISSNWAGSYDDNEKPISTEVTFVFSGQLQEFSVSDLSNMKLTRNGAEIEFSLSGNVSMQPGRGSSDVRTVFFVELSKPLTEPGVYVMTGAYRGKMFTTAEFRVE
jgi:hypothetical protein